MHHILVINSGSSSIKFKIIALPSAKTLVEGSVEGIGESHSYHHLRVWHQDTQQLTELTESGVYAYHQTAFAAVMADLSQFFSEEHLRIDAISHRVVHGGEKFIEPIQLLPEIIHDIAQLTHLAPQHMPSNLMGIRVCMQMFQQVPQFAVFDTAFHHNMPEYAYRYPIPRLWFEDFGIRRYGFHGSSHRYVAETAATLMHKPLNELNLISLHLGNGASACAIQQGKSIDTSMGFTPLEGLMMGSRSGDVDAAIPLYLQRAHQMTAEYVEYQLNFASGLQAICGSHDMHEIIVRAERGDQDASLALEMFVYHVRKYIGAYLVTLGQVDAIIFTGGIAEHSALIRSRCMTGLTRFGISLDDNKNTTSTSEQAADIATDMSETRILLIPTNEELQIATEIAMLLI